jgi:hypothetical protein
MGLPSHPDLGDIGMIHQGAFDLSSADLVSTAFDQVRRLALD